MKIKFSDGRYEIFQMRQDIARIGMSNLEAKQHVLFECLKIIDKTFGIKAEDLR